MYTLYTLCTHCTLYVHTAPLQDRYRQPPREDDPGVPGGRGDGGLRDGQGLRCHEGSRAFIQNVMNIDGVSSTPGGLLNNKLNLAQEFEGTVLEDSLLR